MSETVEAVSPLLVDTHGRPIRRLAKDETCPQCGAGKDKRIATAGFGADPMICCGRCGYHFEGAKE
jgi:hypothetical protein